MNLTDSRLAQAGNEKLELAMLSFFEQFRKIYIGDQVQKSSKVNCLFRWPLLLILPVGCEPCFHWSGLAVLWPQIPKPATICV